jgi:hypothetical protein
MELSYCQKKQIKKKKKQLGSTPGGVAMLSYIDEF